VASALDVARMLRSALAYPEIREATQSAVYLLKTTAGRVIEIEPTNQLLTSYLNKDPYRVILGKTGSLPEAGFCLGMVTRKAEGQQVISVVLGSDTHPSRFQDVKALTAWAFEAFAWK
jgi:D-alanyl-D-alanine carboxypeptidase